MTTDTAAYTDILYTTDTGVATITLNRPKRMNAMTLHTLEEICDALERARVDRGIGVIVITGAGERAFCAGGDLEWETSGGLDKVDYEVGEKLVDHPKPIIARVNGYALGGGNHLAYFCDITIASETAVFGQNAAKVGAPVGGYSTVHAASLIGHKRAREMELMCRHIPARQALEWGLVNAVVPAAELDAEVRRWCDELLACSPTSLRLAKHALRQHMEPYMHLSLMQAVREVAPDFFTSGEQQEGGRAFLEKRKPDFSRWR